VHRHAAFVLERTCAHPRLQHLPLSAYPSDVRQHTARFDQMLLGALTRAGGMVEGRTPAIETMMAGQALCAAASRSLSPRVGGVCDAWRHLQMWPSLAALPRLYPLSATGRC
jgi:hypothetical protein